MTLYTVLVNWNGWHDTIACTRSLLAAEYDALSVVVCDNASCDDSVARLTAWADEMFTRTEATLPRPANDRVGTRTEWIAPDRPGFCFVLLENLDNYGFAGGNNSGIALGLGDPTCRWVFVLNNDTEVESQALRRLVEKAESDPTLAVVGATLVFHDQPDTVQGLGARYNRKGARAKTLFAGGALATLPPLIEVEREMEYVIGAAMFIRAEVLRRTGGLSEDYFLYYEELDFSQRLLPGERLGWAPEAIIRHKVGGTIGTGRVKARASNISIYYDHRSKVRFYRTYWPKLMPWLALRIGKTILAYLRRGDITAVRVIVQAVWDYASKPKEYRANFSRFDQKSQA